MKKFLILLLSFSVVGCASLGSIKKTNQLSPGMTTDQVRSILGQPSQSQFIQNKIVWKYSLHQYFVGWVPYYLVFDKNSQKLETWYANEQEYYRNQRMWMDVANQIEQQNQKPIEVPTSKSFDTDCTTIYGTTHCTTRQNAY
jgi:hypothetical protein